MAHNSFHYQPYLLHTHTFRLRHTQTWARTYIFPSLQTQTSKQTIKQPQNVTHANKKHKQPKTKPSHLLITPIPICKFKPITNGVRGKHMQHATMLSTSPSWKWFPSFRIAIPQHFSLSFAKKGKYCQLSHSAFAFARLPYFSPVLRGKNGL